MSSEDSSNKSEKPTPHKLQESREDGEVAQSRDFTVLIGILFIISSLFFFSKFYLQNISDSYSLLFRSIAGSNLNYSTISELIIQVIKSIATPFLTIIILATIATATANIAQVNGIVFSKKFLELKFDSLNPVTNFKNIFSKKSFFKFCKQFFCVMVFIIISYFLVKKQIPNLLKIWQLPLKDILLYLALIIAIIVCWLLFSYLIFAIIDLIIEKHNHYKNLMMSHDDIKKESKELDGNPEIKSERKRLHQETLNDDKLNDVMQNATFVLSNPTHIALVFLFKPSASLKPYIIAKAKDAKAMEIFRLAKKYQVPIISDVLLARKIYPLAVMGKPAPEALIPELIQLIGQNLNQMPKLYDEIKNRVTSDIKI